MVSPLVSGKSSSLLYRKAYFNFSHIQDVALVHAVLIYWVTSIFSDSRSSYTQKGFFSHSGSSSHPLLNRPHFSFLNSGFWYHPLIYCSTQLTSFSQIQDLDLVHLYRDWCLFLRFRAMVYRKPSLSSDSGPWSHPLIYSQTSCYKAQYEANTGKSKGIV